MKHASVKLGEYTVPLIGIPVNATQQKCSGCGKEFHLSDITLDKNGNPFCPKCLKPTSEIYTNL